MKKKLKDINDIINKLISEKYDLDDDIDNVFEKLFININLRIFNGSNEVYYTNTSS